MDYLTRQTFLKLAFFIFTGECFAN